MELVTSLYTGSGSCPQLELLRGRDGRDGRDGAKGEKGDIGVIGLPGPQGERGTSGNQGATGSQGEMGEKGERGGRGEKGAMGAKGTRGERGLRGRQGEQGAQGLPVGGAVYVRWGRTICPNGTELVYSGRAGGTRYDHKGGASNFLCMPDDPDYLQYISEVNNYNFVSPVEYRFEYMPSLSQFNNHNAPCAVCYTATRGTVLMVPAKTQCPTGWTREYYGYLMSSLNVHGRSMYTCIDKDPESVPGLNGYSNPRSILYLNEINCNGFSCPPYDAQKELTCAVCSR